MDYFAHFKTRLNYGLKIDSAYYRTLIKKIVTFATI